MADAALYFPYINVPDSPALARVLLYWDHVGSIMPDPAVLDPNDLTIRTRELLESGLVRAFVVRSEWFDEEFEGGFFQLLDSEGLLVKPFLAETTRTYFSKMTGAIWAGLLERGLAQGEFDKHGFWGAVDKRAAALYLAYLAGYVTAGYVAAGKKVEPITDQRAYFRDPRDAGSPLDTALLFDQMRGAVLHDVLPAPLEPVPPHELASFKQKHSDLLRDFRRTIEAQLIQCAREDDPELRRRMIEQLRDDTTDGVDEIASRLRERHWQPALGLLCVALAGAPAVAETAITGNPFPASSAVMAPAAELLRKALTGPPTRGSLSTDAPLAYAALAREAFPA